VRADAISAYVDTPLLGAADGGTLGPLVVGFSNIMLRGCYGLGDSNEAFHSTAVVVLSLIALVHLLRLFAGWDVVVTGFVVPVWWSAPILVVFAGLAFPVWREAHD
jgi:hypothetical protein